jgi:CheY-like chemotaxis protein
MSHRIILVGGTPVERGRIESSLRNVGASVLSAESPTEAALLGRQFGPSVLVLLENPTLPAGRQKVALLLNQPGTAAVPLVATDDGVSDSAGVTLLRSLTGLFSCENGGDIVVALDGIFGDDPRDLRRRLTWQRRGPVTLRRIGDFLRRRKSAGTLMVDNGGDGGAIRLDAGRIADAHCGALQGADAIKALLQSDDDQPWGVTYSPGPAPLAAPAPSMPVVLGEPLVESAVDMSVFDDVKDATPRGLSLLPARHDGPVPMRMLLIDDDPALILLYQRTFSHAGHNVTVASDGASGIVTARQFSPDVIVSDIAMPGRTGWDVLASVRADPRLAETPLVLLSCHGDFLSGLQKAAAGANDYIEKGIRAGALLARVEAAAATRRRLLSWGDEVPPSFSARLADIGLFCLLKHLERSQATGEVRVDDGWITIRLFVDQGELTAAAAQHQRGPAPRGVHRGRSTSTAPGAHHRQRRRPPLPRRRRPRLFPGHR